MMLENVGVMGGMCARVTTHWSPFNEGFQWYFWTEVKRLIMMMSKTFNDADDQNL